MKKIIMFFLAGIAIASCSNTGAEQKEVVKDSTSATTGEVKMNYPYTIDHPDNWDMNSTENTMIALSGLKAYENGNIDECVKYFGDSVHIQFDGLDAKVSNDSLKSMFTKSRGGLKSINIKMNDWESVISKDKSEEYVTLWYKEVWEDGKGKKDSLAIVDDIKLKNGKVVQLSESSRKYPAKKM